MLGLPVIKKNKAIGKVRDPSSGPLLKVGGEKLSRSWQLVLCTQSKVQFFLHINFVRHMAKGEEDVKEKANFPTPILFTPTRESMHIMISSEKSSAEMRVRTDTIPSIITGMSREMQISL